MDFFLLDDIDGCLIIRVDGGRSLKKIINQTTCEKMTKRSEFLDGRIESFQLSICLVCSNGGLDIRRPCNYVSIQEAFIRLH